MEEKVTVEAVRSGGKPSLDAAMAAFGALALGFAGYAMPAEVFQGLFGASAAADPDSGARYIAVAAAAAVTFALLFALLRALDRLPSSRRRKLDEIPAEPPRLRRADAHPDAPARWPVFARHELGDPIPAEQPEPEAAAEPVVEPPAEPEAIEEPVEAAGPEEEQPLPGLLGAGLEISEGEPVERDEPVAAEPERPLPSFIAPVEEPVVEAPPAPITWDERSPAPVVEEIAPEPLPELQVEPAGEPEPEPVAELAPDPEPATIAETAPEPEPIAAPEEEVPQVAPEPELVIEEATAPAIEEEAPSPQPMVNELGEVSPEPEEAPLELTPVFEAPVAVEPEPEPEPIEALAARVQLPPARDESVSELMGRLEVGLGRSDRARWLGSSDADDKAEAPADDRLRNAIGMLRRMARKS
jgi:hypothetical protein